MKSSTPTPQISRRLFLGASLALAGTGATQAASRLRAADNRAASAIDAIAAKAIAGSATAGLLVGVARAGRIELARPYGMANLDHAIPVTRGTVFRIGSITKQFAAACILKLREQGRLDLDDPLARHLPGFPQGERFTLRQLLQHTSGLADYTNAKDFETFMRQDAPTPALLEHVGRLEPLFDFEPGTSWKYSNSGYVVIGAVIEKITGQSFAQHLHATLAAPLGLSGTGAESDGEVIPHRACGYEKDPAAPTHFRVAPFISMSVPGAAGAMRSTLGDLVAWHDALFGGRVISRESFEMMRSPARLNDGRLAGSASQDPKMPPFEYGMGLFLVPIEGHPAVGHAGGINGFNCAHYSFPAERLQIVVLTNSESAANELMPGITKAVFAAG